MIVAGLGFRRGCTAEQIVQLVQTAQAQAGLRAASLAAPDWKCHEPGLHAAAAQLGLPFARIDATALAAVQQHCPTRSVVALRETGLASVAEAAALAASGGRLLLARIAEGGVTCALAGP